MIRSVRRVLGAPSRFFRRVRDFMTVEPESRPLGEVVEGAFDDGKTFWAGVLSHVDELRRHLLRSLAAVVLTVSLSFAFTTQLVEFLARPIGGLDALRAIEVTESIGVFMRVALLTGLTAALPYIAFEFWLFIAPGLYPRSRRFALLVIPLATLLFLGGMAFAFFVMLPAALPLLLNFMGIQAELRPQSYFGFVTGLMFWLGVFFEFPLVIYALTSAGLVRPAVLAQQWRLAVVIIALVAAIITPTVDPVNMSLVMLPLILLYFVSIGLSQIAYLGRRRNMAHRAQKEAG